MQGGEGEGEGQLLALRLAQKRPSLHLPWLGGRDVQGKQGIAEHIFRGLVFVLDRNHLENGGYLCVHARSCRALKGNQSSDFVRDPQKPGDRQPLWNHPLSSGC